MRRKQRKWTSGWVDTSETYMGDLSTNRWLHCRTITSRTFRLFFSSLSFLLRRRADDAQRIGHKIVQTLYITFCSYSECSTIDFQIFLGTDDCNWVSPLYNRNISLHNIYISLHITMESTEVLKRYEGLRTGPSSHRWEFLNIQLCRHSSTSCRCCLNSVTHHHVIVIVRHLTSRKVCTPIGSALSDASPQGRPGQIMVAIFCPPALSALKRRGGIIICRTIRCCVYNRNSVSELYTRKRELAQCVENTRKCRAQGPVSQSPISRIPDQV